MVLKDFTEAMLLQYARMHPIALYGGVFIQYFKVCNILYITLNNYDFKLKGNTKYFLEYTFN